MRKKILEQVQLMLFGHQLNQTMIGSWEMASSKRKNKTKNNMKKYENNNMKKYENKNMKKYENKNKKKYENKNKKKYKEIR